MELNFWNSYLDTVPDKESLQDVFVEAMPAGNFQITDNLIELYFAGKKIAGSSLVEDFASAGDPLPKVGNFWIVLASDKKPKLILKTKKIEIHKFAEVPQYVATAEGEGDLSLDYWKREHAKIYEPHLANWGIKDLNQANVITEFFELVFS